MVIIDSMTTREFWRGPRSDFMVRRLFIVWAIGPMVLGAIDTTVEREKWRSGDRSEAKTYWFLFFVIAGRVLLPDERATFGTPGQFPILVGLTQPHFAAQ